MLIASIIIYLLLTLAIGLVAGKFIKNTRDFAVAGRKMPMFVSAAALFATWFGAETVFGASAEFVKHGVLGIIEDPFGAALCLILLGLFFARPLYQFDLLTMSDFFKQKFGPRVELIAALFMMISYFGWTTAQLLAFAIILDTVVGVPINIGILIAAAIVLIYTYSGGMFAVSITDFVQTIVIIGGLLFIAITLIIKLDDPSIVITAQRPGFFDFTPKPNLDAYLQYICAWLTISLGSIPQQDVFQRIMSAKSADTAVKSCFVGGLMYLTVGLLPPIIALIALQVYPDLSVHDGQEILVNAVMKHGDIWIQILFFGALLSAIMSTASGSILASATTLSENIIKPLLPKLDDKHFLLVMRLSVVLMTVVGVLLANSGKSIYEMVGESSVLSLVSLFVPFIAGLWWKKATPFGAELSILAGVGFWYYAEKFPVTLMDAHVPSLFIGTIASAVAMLFGSLVGRKWQKLSD